MKNLNIYINESTSSKSFLSDFESNYDINKLSEKINDELKDAKVTLDINLGNYTTKLNTINNYKYNASSNSMLIGTIIEHAILSWLKDNENVTPQFRNDFLDIDDEDVYSLADGKLSGNQDVEIKAFSREIQEEDDGYYIKKGIKLTSNQMSSIKKSVMILVNYEVKNSIAVIKQIFVKHPNQLIVGSTSILKILK